MFARPIAAGPETEAAVERDVLERSKVEAHVEYVVDAKTRWEQTLGELLLDERDEVQHAERIDDTAREERGVCRERLAPQRGTECFLDEAADFCRNRRVVHARHYFATLNRK